MFKVKNIPVHPDYDKYPSSDGELMAETTLHAKWIHKVRGNLDALTQGQAIFVAHDLLWYPVEGRVEICKAPDVMVAFGRPKGDRDSYLQWLENNVPPQVVFEIFSKSNRCRPNKENLLDFYTKHGVQEYYSYDPVKNVFLIHLRQGDRLIQLEGLQMWTSPLLGIRFEWSEKTFEIYHPNGERFLTFEELENERKHFALKAAEAEKFERIAMREALAEAQRADAAEQKADAAEQKADVAEQKADVAQQEAEFAKQLAASAKLEADDAKQEADIAKLEVAAAANRQKLLEAKLRELGVDPNVIF